MAASLNDGRFSGFDASRFNSEFNSGIIEALDNETGETVIVKFFKITSSAHLESAQEEAQTLQKLRKLWVFNYVYII